MEQSDETIEPDGVSASNVFVLDRCKCGRAPHRKGQRNCHFCNREANKKYHRSLKRHDAAIANMVGRIRSI